MKIPVLLTHHFRMVDQRRMMGGPADIQAPTGRALLGEVDEPVAYRWFGHRRHSMHGQAPKLFTETAVDWIRAL